MFSNSLGPWRLPVWPYPLVLLIFTHFLLPRPLVAADSLVLNLLGAGVGYLWELGWLKLFVPPERILRFIESKLNLLSRLPHYVSVDQKTFGRYGAAVLPSSSADLAVPGLSGLGLGRRMGGNSPRLAIAQVLGPTKNEDSKVTA